MARIGGRAARWAGAASALAAIALLVPAGIALTGEDADLRPAAVDGTAPGPGPGTTDSSAPAVAAPPSSAAADRPVTGSASVPRGTGASTGTPSSGAPSSSAPSAASSAAASSPATAALSPGPAQPEYPTVAGTSADAPFVSFVGDSWTYGTGATDRTGYAYLTGRLLGWTHRVLGVNGSGYVRGGAGDVQFDERIAAAVSGEPDVVVVQGSINERSTPADELAPAVAATLDRLVRAAGPKADVVVLGASHVPGVPDQYVDRVNDTLRAETARLGLPFVDVAAEVWSDPSDPGIWADPYHVNDVGSQQIADRLAPVLEALLAG
jgi:lysophospholipase L1-like esterase